MSDPFYDDLDDVPDDTDVPADGDDSIPPEDREPEARLDARLVRALLEDTLRAPRMSTFLGNSAPVYWNEDG